MNAPTELSNVVQIAGQQPQKNVTSNDLMMNPEAMDRVMRMAEMMAGGTCTIPLHLQKKPADCMAVVMQSMQWGMNPFAVAQKTHITQGGALGYEAQLISAVISANAQVKEKAPMYEYIGDWSTVLGKVEERKSEKGGKYYVATYTKADEAGLGVICKMTLLGESTPRETTLMMSQCWPRFSTQWATDPKQQIGYAAIRKWARQHSPGTILGVYSPDELDTQETKDMGPAQVVRATEQGASDDLVSAARAAAAQGKAAFAKFWNGTPKDTRPQLRHIRAELDQTAANFDAARTVDTPPAKPATQQQANKTLAEVMKMLTNSTDIDQLYTAGDWIGGLDDPEERKVAAAKFDELKFVLEME
jgi:hypothetical protein